MISKLKSTNCVILLLASFFIGLSLPVTSHGYMEFMDTGEVLDSGKYRLNGNVQGIFNDFDGFNITGRAATGVTKDSEVQFEFGLGSIEVQFTGYFKYVPFPDTDNQPAIGIRAGGSFARFEGESLFGVHLQPFASKKFDTEYGDFTPYGALNLSLVFIDDDSEMPLQLQLGNSWKPENYSNVEFYGELGLNLAKSFNYISLGVAVTFDSFSNIQFN